MNRKLCKRSNGRRALARVFFCSAGQRYRAAMIPQIRKLRAMLAPKTACGDTTDSFLKPCVARQLQRLVGRRNRDGSWTPEHHRPEERLSLESFGLVETTGSKIRDLEHPAELVSELVLGDEGDGKLRLLGGAERQKQ